MSSSNKAIRNDDRLACGNSNLSDYDLMQSVQNCTFFINDYYQRGEINVDQIEKIGEVLEHLQYPEEYGLNLFLIRLISETSEEEIANVAYLVLNNNFDNKEIKLNSFNASSLANDDAFTIFLNLLTSPDEDQDQFSDISLLLINQIFEKMPTRDFISIEIYENLFDYILSRPNESCRLFTTIILEIEEIDPRFHQIIIEIISNYLENTSPISNPNIFAAVFGLSQLLLAEIDVPQELLQSCTDIFVKSYDKELISLILYNMTMYKEPPFFAFSRILEIITNFDSQISLLAIRVMAKFCMDWIDSQKEELIDYLLDIYPNLYYESSKYAMYIILKTMKKLPNEPSFFSALINGIETCDYKPLSLACAQLIIRDWMMEEIDEEKFTLVGEFLEIVERLLQSEDATVSDMCQTALYSLEDKFTENKF